MSLSVDTMNPAPNYPNPVIHRDAINLTYDEKILFSVLEAAADYHFSQHPSADYSTCSSSTSSTVGTDDESSDDQDDLLQKIERLQSQRSIFATTETPSDVSDSDNTNAVTSTCLDAPPCNNRTLNIRVAGGWVRDKLLNLQSHDIDVVLDDASGVQFAHMVREYLESLEDMVTSNGEYDDNEKIRRDEHRHHHRHHKYKIGVIKSNPYKSEHLQTATMKIFGLDIDFVNFRSEEKYHPHSRIPIQLNHSGTPYEDAHRRDFTINALFYNIRTGCIEDYTHRGLSDLLCRRILETPLNPHSTCLDDPLRVLRAIRFSARFGFDLADDLKQAAMSQEVRNALMVKISRERVGCEFEGMLSGKAARPGEALRIINDLNLSDAIFMMPLGDESEIRGRVCHCCSDDDMEAVCAEGWKESRKCLDYTEQVLSAYKEWRRKTNDDNNGYNLKAATSVTKSTAAFTSQLDEHLIYLGAYLLPFSNFTFIDRKGPNPNNKACRHPTTRKVQQKRQRIVTMSMMRDSIKFQMSTVQQMEQLYTYMPSFCKLLSSKDNDHTFSSSETTTTSTNKHHYDRLEVSSILCKVKQLWITCLLLATIFEMNKCSSTCSKNDDGDDNEEKVPPRTAMIPTLLLNSCMSLYQFIVEDEHLDGCWNTQYLVNGKEIIQLLNLNTSGGPIIREYKDYQWKWIMKHPTGTKEECQKSLIQYHHNRKGKKRDGDIDSIGKE